MILYRIQTFDLEYECLLDENKNKERAPILPEAPLTGMDKSIAN